MIISQRPRLHRFAQTSRSLTRSVVATLTAGISVLVSQQSAADIFVCDTQNQTQCTLQVAPSASSAGLTLRAPGTQFEPLPEGRGFTIRGTVELLAGPEQIQGHSIYESQLVVEYNDPSQPQLGFRRLRGSALMNFGADANTNPAFGMFAGTSELRRVDVGIELGSILQSELQIQHLNPARPCEGKTFGEPGFRECPYWVFQYLETQNLTTGFGGTDIGMTISADGAAETKVVVVMDPADFFMYVGASKGGMDSLTLNIQSTSAAEEPEDPFMTADHGIGFSQQGYIPFVPRTTYALESFSSELSFLGHLVIDQAGIPLDATGTLTLDGSVVWKLPIDEVTQQARFDGHFQLAGNGDVKVNVPLFKDFLNWEMKLSEATAASKFAGDRQVLAFSGLIKKEFDWKPKALPLSLDYRNNYYAAGVFANEFDQLAVLDSFVQIEGEFLLDLGFGSSGSSLNRNLSSHGFLRTDFDRGIVFSGSIGSGAGATLIHPLIQADGAVGTRIEFAPWDVQNTMLELTGEFAIGGSSSTNEGVLRIRHDDAYIGFATDFDPDLILTAYNDIQQATRDAEAEVTRLNAEVARLRSIVSNERAQQRADIDAATADVNAAQAEVNRLKALITQYNKDISYYKGRITYWYNWYKNQAWYNKPTAYATYLAKAAYYNGLIATRYTAIGAVNASILVANVALDIAKGSLAVANAALIVTPIDADPRVAAVIISRDAALAVLNGIQDLMPEIPEIPGTITATAGFKIDANGLHPQTRAEYCDNGSCIEIKDGEYDPAKGRACITLPGIGKRVCTAVPFEP